ncbi:21275_t:CDS:2 [Cetraspora pellucida]|uniref:21275_t:CDS:1 n=1 Tax=Cetraspora pellucida TaxID=1433469 RepID=A0A9N9I5B3_9GLOM|nr:21275_t:CDS:2 [Cetraspora pellucida]
MHSIITTCTIVFLYWLIFSVSVENAQEASKQTQSTPNCFSMDCMNKYQRYLLLRRTKWNTIKENKTITELDKKAEIDLINDELLQAEGFKNLTFGLINIFDKLINDSYSIEVSNSFYGETLLLISKFYYNTLKTSGSDFLQKMWNQNVNEGDHEHEAITDDDDSYEHGRHRENMASDLVNNFLQEVGVEADRLEKNMHNHKFTDNSKMHGSLDMVVKLEDEDEDGKKQSIELSQSEESRHHSSNKVMMLVDRDNNEYILMRPNDLSMFYEVAGCVLGPAGFNMTQELIQTETLSQFGVIFIVFMLGLEFSFNKLKSIWQFALGSVTMIFALIVSLSVFIGFVIGAKTNEAIFVGACVSLSSTAIVKRLNCKELESLHGVLIVQDILFGASLHAFSKTDIEVILTAGHLILSMVLFCIFSLLVANLPISWILKTIKGSNKHELFLLGSISLCLIMSHVSFMLGLGVEIGCFIAGILISNHKSIAESSITLVEPVKDIFSCLFFSSIGLHVYPSFFINEGILLFILTICAIGFKFVICSVTLMVFGHTFERATTMAIGLSQISEYVFILSSRAKSLEIISREVYYVILAVTSLTLIVTPILWNTIYKRQKDIPIGGYRLLTNDSDLTISLPTNNIGKAE